MCLKKRSYLMTMEHRIEPYKMYKQSLASLQMVKFEILVVVFFWRELTDLYMGKIK